MRVTAPWRLFEGPLDGGELRERDGDELDRAAAHAAARGRSQATPRGAIRQDGRQDGLDQINQTNINQNNIIRGGSEGDQRARQRRTNSMQLQVPSVS